MDVDTSDTLMITTAALPVSAALTHSTSYAGSATNVTSPLALRKAIVMKCARAHQMCELEYM